MLVDPVLSVIDTAELKVFAPPTVCVPAVRTTVPVSSGNVIVLAAVGSVIANDVSNPLAVAPSKTSGVAPAMVPVTVTTSDALSPSVALPLSNVAPVTPSVPESNVFPVALRVPPTNRFSLMPAPPDTFRAPVVELVDVVVAVTETSVSAVVAVAVIVTTFVEVPAALVTANVTLGVAFEI